MKRTKVLIVISSLEFGGAERQVVEIANSTSDEFEVHVCVLSDYVPLGSSFTAESATRLHILEKRRKFDVGLLFRLRRLIKALDIDLVHGFLYDAEIAARLAGFLAGVRVIGSERNSRHYHGKLKVLVGRITAPLLDACVANSAAGYEYHKKTYGLPDDRYFVVRNGVDIERFKPRAPEPAKFGLPLDRPVIGMIGSFKKQKNHEMLLRAAVLVKRKRPDFVLAFVGSRIHDGVSDSSAYERRVDGLVRELGLDAQCIFLGNLDNVQEFYPACAFTVLPSLFEGTPNVALESLACGVPVIATDVGDNAVAIEDGACGYIVPLAAVELLAERMLTLLEDEPRRAAFAAEARRRVERTFTTACMVENMMNVYRAVMAGRRGGRPADALVPRPPHGAP